MRVIIFIFALSLLVPSFAKAQEAAQAKNLKIVISGVLQHKDYEELAGGLKRIIGISDLFVSTEARGRIVLAGRFAGETAMLANDTQALVMDRYKFDKKERKDFIEITLTKL